MLYNQPPKKKGEPEFTKKQAIGYFILTVVLLAVVVAVAVIITCKLLA